MRREETTMMEVEGETADGSPLFSPAEERICGLLRRGTVDAEIAVRLGMTVGQLKGRIAGMQRRAGVQTREELAAWSSFVVRETPPAQAPIEHTVLLREIAAEHTQPGDFDQRATLTAWRSAVAGAGVMGLLLGGVLGWFAAAGQPRDPGAATLVERAPAAEVPAAEQATAREEYWRFMDVSFTKPPAHLTGPVGSPGDAVSQD